MGKVNDEANPCQCAKCRKTFDYKDTVIKERKLYGKPLKENCCPFCGGSSMTPLKELWWLNKYNTK